MKPNLICILAPFIVFVGTITTLQAQFRPPDRSGDRSSDRSGDRSSDRSDGRSRFGDGSGAERFFGYMDRNRDGQLDQDEIRRMPSSFRESFERQGVRLDRGISRDQFVREMPRMMDEMRRRRESERSSSSSDDERRREEYRQRAEQQRRDDSRRTSQPRTEFYTPRKSEPLTVDLPSRFEDGDTDQDGQIGYYEWRKWKPDAKAEFKLRDQNDDGFLTPRELLRPLPAVPTSTEVAAAPSNGSTAPGNANGSSNGDGRNGDRGGRSFRGRGDRSGFRGPGGPSSASASPAGSSTSSSGADDKLSARAKYMFNTMDADKDEQISKEELDKSRLIKPKFEEAGIDMSQPMNESQFIAAYLKAFSS